MSFPKIGQMLLPGDLANYSINPEKGSHPRALTGISTVNFFVGENNSGKSRLLRCLASNANPIIRIADFPADLIDLKKATYETIDYNPSKEFAELWEEIEFPSATIDTSIIHQKLNQFISDMFRGGVESRLRRKQVTSYPRLVETRKNSKRKDLYRIYIPVLRSLRPVPEISEDEKKDYYAHRTTTDYFKGRSPDEVYTGLTFYRDLKALLLGNHRQRKTAKDFEDFLRDELFGGVAVTLIPREGSDVVWFKLGDTEEREIHNVGDGLQQLIILMFPLFKNKEKSCHVYIEEPELFLHPGLQRALIKAMRTFGQNQYFISTHSNHFLDLSLEFDDISIYTLHREKLETEAGTTQEDRFVISLVSSHDFRVLEMLGARTSSVFLSNCTVWVEGITDRRYLAHFLELYLEQLKTENPGHFVPRQDLHFSFVEYSGGNITHWSFLDNIDDPILVDRLCAKSMLVTDKDSGKEERHLKLEKSLGENFHCLPCKEIENLLTREVVKAIMIFYGESEDTIPSFQRGEYSHKPLGKYLDDLLGEAKKRTGKYGSDSGTVTDKLKFCSRAIEAMAIAGQNGEPAFTFEMLSKPAQELTKSMYVFICNANGQSR